MKASIALIMIAASFAACSNNLNTGLKAPVATPEGLVDKAQKAIKEMPASVKAEMGDTTKLVIHLGAENMSQDDSLYQLDGSYVGRADQFWCDNEGQCFRDTLVDGINFGTMQGALKTELKKPLGAGEVCVGNCAPATAVTCAPAGNYTYLGADYTGRINCIITRVDGNCYMTAAAVPCEGANETCQMIGTYPNFGVCGTCEVGDTCDDGNVCTNDGCNPVTHTCQYVNNTNPCPDGDLCNGAEMCASGFCKSGTALNCLDGNDCTTDSCGPATGCLNVSNSVACDDGNACTTGDTCVNKTCQGSSLPCDDGKPCTTDTCASNGGCVYTNAQNTTVCNDGNACTSGDECQAGLCAGPQVKTCNDANPCTNDSCNTSTGACSNTPVTDGTMASTCPANNQCVAGACHPNNMVCSTNGDFTCFDNVIPDTNAHYQCVVKPGGTVGLWTLKTVCGNKNVAQCNPNTGCSSGTPAEADCTDGIDNDGDGATDCTDSDCKTTTACAPSCTPSCVNKTCGSDGCGATCGSCVAGQFCSASGQCLPNQPGGATCTTDANCLDTEFCGIRNAAASGTCYPYSNQHGQTADLMSGANGGGPEIGPGTPRKLTAQGWDGDGDGFCADPDATKCYGTEGNAAQAQLKGGDCDDTSTGVGNNPGVQDWSTDKFDNNCDGVLACQTSLQCPNGVTCQNGTCPATPL